MKGSASVFNLRLAMKEDQAVIRCMILGARLNPLGLHWKGFLLAEDEDGNVLGCGQIKGHADGSRELASIYVKPEKRGRGLARAIIQGLLSDQAPPVWLTCQRALVDFYRRYGFQEIRDVDMMPAYFRRVRRLVGALSFMRGGNPLAVMRWDGD
ncbi:MAG: GNAT family N-acetyltransferase [Anaerolineales bacterium]|nr:GNAT family N-acetyltransferase [Anaerolineales bacterium]